MLEKECKLLRVSRHPDMEEVRRAFVRLTRRYPPEHFPEKFKAIKGAYDRLTLNWDSIKPLARDLAFRETPESIKQYLLEEAREAGGDSGSNQSVQLDVYTLEPILNLPAHREKLYRVLDDIRERGLPYLTDYSSQ